MAISIRKIDKSMAQLEVPGIGDGEGWIRWFGKRFSKGGAVFMAKCHAISL